MRKLHLGSSLDSSGAGVSSSLGLGSQKDGAYGGDPGPAWGGRGQPGAGAGGSRAPALHGRPHSAPSSSGARLESCGNLLSVSELCWGHLGWWLYLSFR